MSIICPICLEEYKNSMNSEKTPRILSCSDTMCTQCLRKLKKDNVIECPICKKQNFEEVEEIRPNKFIIDLIEQKILSAIKYLDDKNIALYKPDYHFNVALTGESGAGKTSICNFYKTDKPILSTLPTIGLDNSFKFLSVHQKLVKITLWDTAGEERYRSLSIGYLRGVHAMVLVFSLTNLLDQEELKIFKQKSKEEKNKIKEDYTKNTIKDLNFWLQQFKMINSQSMQIIYLVGNKNDIGEEYRLIQKDELNNFVINNNLNYYETSALTGDNIKKMFDNLTFELLSIYSNSEDANTAKSFKLKNVRNNSEKCKC